MLMIKLMVLVGLTQVFEAVESRSEQKRVDLMLRDTMLAISHTNVLRCQITRC
jgi:hypothetical protein